MGTCGRRFRRALSIKLSVFNKIVTYQKMFSDDGNEKIIM